MDETGGLAWSAAPPVRNNGCPGIFLVCGINPPDSGGQGSSGPRGRWNRPPSCVMKSEPATARAKRCIVFEIKTLAADRMRCVYTDGASRNFIALCRELDSFLNEPAGGEQNRAQYTPHNRLDDIRGGILAYDKSEPVGCAAFKQSGAECAEMKRALLRAAYQGLGTGRAPMVLLEEAARKKGRASLILKSGEPLQAAMALYRKRGYRVIPNYGPYRDMPDSICMGKLL